MKIYLLENDYKNNLELYDDFISDGISENKSYFSKEYIEVENPVEFPIYFNVSSEIKKIDFYTAVDTIYDNFLDLGPKVFFSEKFWHSYFIFKRNYLMKIYGDKINKSYKDFKNIVLKKFDWENYVYKSMMVALFLKEEKIERSEFYKYVYFINDNLDFFNYIIKTTVFRNEKLINKLLIAVKNLDLSSVINKQIINSVKEDDRVGRNIIQRLNFYYPMQIPHLFSQEELETEILNILKDFISEEDHKLILKKYISRKG